MTPASPVVPAVLLVIAFLGVLGCGYLLGQVRLRGHALDVFRDALTRRIRALRSVSAHLEIADAAVRFYEREVTFLRTAIKGSAVPAEIRDRLAEIDRVGAA